MEIKKGMIILWSGSVASIPGGWALCNGSNGTPDLRNNFVVGAGDSYAVDATGGAISHQHDIEPPQHNHTLNGNEGTCEAGGEGPEDTSYFQQDYASEGSQNLPPYLALAYIMKL